jgi:hypothetical protein
MYGDSLKGKEFGRLAGAALRARGYAPDVGLLRRRGRDAAAPAGGLPRRRNAGLLRRERRALLAVRARRLGDLGGLTLEMYRFGAWRSDLLEERCAELAGIEVRIADIEALLHRGEPVERCGCGAPRRPGAQFCSNCGRVFGAAGVGADTVVEPPPPGG